MIEIMYIDLMVQVSTDGCNLRLWENVMSCHTGFNLYFHTVYTLLILWNDALQF